MEPVDKRIATNQKYVCPSNRIEVLHYLHISVKHGCLDTGSSSNDGGTWPYTISQLISSKSEYESMIKLVQELQPKFQFSSELNQDNETYLESWLMEAQIHW